MKKIAVILAGLALSASLNAQAPTSSYSITVDFPYTSKYVFRGVELAKDSVQPSIEFASGNWYAGIWTNQPVKGKFENEFDFYLGTGIPLNETWSLDAGGTLYYYPELPSSVNPDNTTTEFYLGLTGTVGGFSPSAYTYYDTDLKTWTHQVALGYNIPLSNTLSLDLSGTIGMVDPRNGSDYVYHGIGATIPYKLSDAATASISAQYAGTDISGMDDHVYFTVGLTFGL